MKTTPEEMATMGMKDTMSKKVVASETQGSVGPVVVTQIAKAKLTLAEVQSKLVPEWQRSLQLLIDRDCTGGPPSCGCWSS